MTGAVLTLLSSQLKGMREAAKADDVRAMMQHDMRFHEIIIEASGNNVLLDMWHSLRIETGTFVSVIKSDWDLGMIAEMHAPVFQALKLRAPDLAAKQLRNHIEFFGSLVLKSTQILQSNESQNILRRADHGIEVRKTSRREKAKRSRAQSP